MATVSDFLDRLIGRRKASSAPANGAAKVPVEDNELYKEVSEFGKAHPELQEQYPDFDSLAEYYVNNVRNKPSMTAESRVTDKDGNVVKEEQVVLQPSSKEEMFGASNDTLQFLDRLTKK